MTTTALGASEAASVSSSRISCLVAIADSMPQSGRLGQGFFLTARAVQDSLLLINLHSPSRPRPPSPGTDQARARSLIT
jgi:hypothetical protein